MTKKIMLLGSGELGKELTIALQRLGSHIIAVDSYVGAPAMQVADECEVIDMLDGDALDKIVSTHAPDIIVPEIEAIRTERFYDYEASGIHVVPSARAANYTMNRRAIRDLAAQLGIRTAGFRYASTRSEFEHAISEIGLPCVVKPLMSSSGKGQSTVHGQMEIEPAWQIAQSKGRGDAGEVIVEEFIRFDSEITLLTVTQKDGETLFCAPIGHRQERGDYMESWQPAEINQAQIEAAQQMAAQITGNLGGAGIWGVEFFLRGANADGAADGVYFSELSPRPHDTGMVTLAGTQNLNQFELHARAILGLPIPSIDFIRTGASAVILAHEDSSKAPSYTGLVEALSEPRTDLRIFGKPSTRVHRRMGVALAYEDASMSTHVARERAKKAADCVRVVT